MYKFKVYHPKYCPKCQFSLNYLKGADVDSVLIKDDNRNSMNTFIEKGYTSFPIIQVIEDGVLIDEWQGLNMQKLRKYQPKKG